VAKKLIALGNILRAILDRGSVVRPPGAVVENEFLKLCIKCNLCIEACRVAGSGTLERCSILYGLKKYGTPRVNPLRAPCEAVKGRCEPKPPCIRVCFTGALQLIDTSLIKLGSVVWIKDRCIAATKGGCLVCYEVCPIPGAIKITKENTPEFNMELCIGCGRCVNACPAKPKALKLLAKGEKRIVI